jgi:hypothetical protein
MEKFIMKRWRRKGAVLVVKHEEGSLTGRF